jgi:hypothetical protein
MSVKFWLVVLAELFSPALESKLALPEFRHVTHLQQGCPCKGFDTANIIFR